MAWSMILPSLNLKCYLSFKTQLDTYFSKNSPEATPALADLSFL